MVRKEERLFFEGFLYGLIKDNIFSFRYAGNPCNEHDFCLTNSFVNAKEVFPGQLNFFIQSPIFGNCPALDELVSLESGIFLYKDYPEGFVPGQSTPRYTLSNNLLFNLDAKESYTSNKKVIDCIIKEYKRNLNCN